MNNHFLNRLKKIELLFSFIGRNLLIIAFIYFLYPSKSYSINLTPVHVENSNLNYPLHTYTKYLRVTKNEYNEKTILNKLNEFNYFDISQLEIDNEGKYDYWFLFSIKSKKFPLYLTLPNIQYYHLDLFKIEDGKLLPLSSGGIKLPASRKYFSISKEIFFLPKASGDTSTYLLKANRLTFKSFGAEIYPSDALISKNYKLDFFEGILMGIILCVILHNLLMYFNSREKVYGLLAIYMFFVLLQVCSYAGHFNAFISFESVKWNEIFYNLLPSLSAFFSFQFSYYFLDLKTIAQKWIKITYLVFLWIFIISGLSAIFSIPVLNQLTILASGFAVIFLLTAGIIRFKKKFKPATTYLVAYLPSFISIPYLLYYNMGKLEYNWFTHNNLLISIVLQAILFSLANAQKIKLLKEKNELLLLGEKEKLEGMVIIRTSELQLEKNNVEEQKRIIEEKQKEILDSIHYAKRLQEAILPPLKFIDEYVPNNFVLYQPKDVVAGDFYWAETKDNKFFIAAADCTGHGVPGAMVSVVCSNALNRTVNEFGITDTGKILDKTRELVLETFAKGNAEVKDGMDISLLCIDKQINKAFWSGANNPLWYVQSSVTSSEVEKSIDAGLEVPVKTVTSSEVEKSTSSGLDSARPDIQLIEIKADKQPIGKTDHAKPFTTHEIALQEGMLFYLFTDGFADQFGGPKGKKFKYKQLEELLLANANKSMNEQHETLSQQFALWKGDLEQVDDVCVIGVKF